MGSVQHTPNLALLRAPNQANGVVAADANGDVLGRWQHMYDTAANILATVLKSGEFAYAWDTQEYFVGDGVTAGGIFFKQIPQRKNLYLASLVGAPTLGAATDLTSITFRRSLGATYRLDATIWFVNDTSNASNFGFKFRYGGIRVDLMNASLYHIERVQWHHASTNLLLESGLFFANSTQGLTGVLRALTAANQNLSTAQLNVSIDIKSTTNPADLYADVMDLTPVPRTGATSTASAYVYATCERVA